MQNPTQPFVKYFQVGYTLLTVVMDDDINVLLKYWVYFFVYKLNLHKFHIVESGLE